MMLIAYQKELEQDRYKPLPKKEANLLAINFSGDSFTRDKIINSTLRLAYKAVKITVRDGSKTDEELMDLIQTANEAICEALLSYKYDNIDFAYYAYVSAINAIKKDLKDNQTVKPRKVNGELKFAEYEFIDIPKFDDSGEERELEYEESPDDPCEDLIQAINNLDIQEHKKQIFLYRYNFGDMKQRPYKEIQEKFGYSEQRICQIIFEVTNKIKENPEIFKEIYGII